MVGDSRSDSHGSESARPRRSVPNVRALLLTAVAGRAHSRSKSNLCDALPNQGRPLGRNIYWPQ
jgi:hypothetical protein